MKLRGFFVRLKIPENSKKPENNSAPEVCFGLTDFCRIIKTPESRPQVPDCSGRWPQALKAGLGLPTSANFLL